MRKEERYEIVFVSVLLILSMSMVSAGWFGDFFNKLFSGEDKITGMAVSCSCEYDWETDSCVATEFCPSGYTSNCEPDIEGVCIAGCTCLADEGTEECTSGDCCDLEYGSPDYQTFLSPGTECSLRVDLPEEYRCSALDCGEQVEEQIGYKVKKCTGSSSACPAYIEYPAWGVYDDCNPTEICESVLETIPFRCRVEASCSAPPPPPPVGECGDETLDVENDEECDGDNLDGKDCTDYTPGSTFTGGFLDCYAAETANECQFDVTGCTSFVCGNGAVEGTEQCDDGETTSGDGCSDTCVTESGYSCPTPGSACVADNICGDGTVGGTEVCDDGNSVETDACLDTCVAAFCGDGHIWTTDGGSEVCDDGDTDDTNACSNSCTITSGCGDEKVEAGEDCDDGNADNTDGCTTDCNILTDWECTAIIDTISVCTNCDVDGDGALNDSCSGGTDCNDDDPEINPGASEMCGNDVDENCDDVKAGACPEGPCVDGDGDKYPGTFTQDCYDGNYFDVIDCNDGDAAIYPGATEICGNGVKENCNLVEADEGCFYHNIISLTHYVDNDTAFENSKIPLVCYFAVVESTDQSASTIMAEKNVSAGCIKASVAGDTTKCTMTRDTFQPTTGEYTRTFMCESGAVSTDKQLRCVVDNNSVTGCPKGFYPSSGLGGGVIDVISPVECPAGSTESPIIPNVGEAIEATTFDAGEILTIDMFFDNTNALEPQNLFITSSLYEVNNKLLLVKKSGTATLQETGVLELKLTMPSLVSEEGRYRLYTKITTEDEDETCLLRMHDIVLLPGGGAAVIDFDFREQRTHRIRSLVNQIKTFTLNGIVEHSLEVTSISGNTVEMTIQSDPIDITLDKGESIDVDLDNDQVDDIKITLSDIISGEAVLNLEALAAVGGCTDGATQDCGAGDSGTQVCIGDAWSSCRVEDTGSSDDDSWFEDTGDDGTGTSSSSGSNAWIWILAIALVIGIIIMVFFMRRKISKVGGARPPASRPPALPSQPQR